MVPSTYEDGTLYNVLPSGNKAPDETGNHNGYDQTRADFSFTRGSNLAATRVNSDGLIEKGRENLLLQSNSFDTTWTDSGANVSVTSGQSGYDGTNNAWELDIDYTGGDGYLRQEKSISGVNTFSIYAKKNSADGIYIEFAAGNYPNIKVDLTDGSLISTNGTIDTNIESVGNGWYRISFSVNQSLARVNIRIVNGSGTNTTGTIYIQNAQLEKGLVATDYIETGSTTAQAGILEDMPRINYDANGENGALLLEPSRTNLITNSEYFGGWSIVTTGTGQSPTITTNYATSPDGSTNATRIQFDLNGGTTSSDRVIIRQSLTTQTDYYFSVWMKSATGTDQKILWHSNGDANETTVTNEWQRFEYDRNSQSIAWAGLSLRGATSSVDTADILVWGFQAERASYASSYIPSYGSAVTRSADSITSGTVTAPLSGGYTAFIEVETLSTSVYNQIQFRETAANYVLRIGNQVNVGAGSLVQANTTGMNKFALQVSSGGAFELFKNGSSVGTGTGITHDIELIKTDLAGQNVKQVIVFDSALTDAECVTLTTL